MSEASELELRERGGETEGRSGFGSESGSLNAFLVLWARGRGRAASCRKDSGRKRAVRIVKI